MAGPSPVTGLLRLTPSLLDNNLVKLPKHVGYASASAVALVPANDLPLGGDGAMKRTTELGGGQLAGGKVTGVSACTIGEEAYLVVSSQQGARIFDGATGARLLFSLRMPADRDLFGGAKPPARYADNGAFCTAACAARSDDGRTQIVVGTSAGALLVVAVDGTRFSHAHTVKAGGEDGAHASPVTALGADAVAAAAGDARREVATVGGDGDVVVWAPRSASQYEAYWRLPDTSPCAGVAVRGALLYVGRRDGRLSIYDTTSKSLVHDIVAHSRLLSSLTVHPRLPYVATTSEDTTVAVWRIADGAVSCALSAKWPTALLTGSAFLDDGGVAVAAYDVAELRVYGGVTVP